MEQKIKLISVNMGYGHQRTAFPLRELAGGEIIQANDYDGIPENDKKIWETIRRFYEFISNLTRISFFGPLFFSLFDRMQKILNFYPKKEFIDSTFQLNQLFSLMRKGWGRDLIEKNNSNVPLISTFFTPAFMAEFFNYSGEIFCIVSDTDASRAWAPQNPKKSRIKYFAPTERVFDRLQTYGIKKENIFFTGYPLPLENIGEKGEIAKEDLKRRILNLDPDKRYFHYYEPLIKKYLDDLSESSGSPLTIMFSVGGAGAQKEIGIKIARSLSPYIKTGQIKLVLAAGIKEKVKNYFLERLDSHTGIEILFGENIEDYFRKFNEALRTTDILWTKPSELSFYAALGLPIIIAPPIGSQEEFNKRWLIKSGFGILQEDPAYCHQWLFDWLKKGYLAEAAMQGFIEGEKFGVLKIKNIIESRLQ